MKFMTVVVGVVAFQPSVFVVQHEAFHRSRELLARNEPAEAASVSLTALQSLPQDFASAVGDGTSAIPDLKNVGFLRLQLATSLYRDKQYQRSSVAFSDACSWLEYIYGSRSEYTASCITSWTNALRESGKQAEAHQLASSLAERQSASASSSTVRVSSCSVGSSCSSRGGSKLGTPGTGPQGETRPHQDVVSLWTDVGLPLAEDEERDMDGAIVYIRAVQEALRGFLHPDTTASQRAQSWDILRHTTESCGQDMHKDIPGYAASLAGELLDLVDGPREGASRGDEEEAQAIREFIRSQEAGAVEELGALQAVEAAINTQQADMEDNAGWLLDQSVASSGSEVSVPVSEGGSGANGGASLATRGHTRAVQQARLQRALAYLRARRDELVRKLGRMERGAGEDAYALGEGVTPASWLDRHRNTGGQQQQQQQAPVNIVSKAAAARKGASAIAEDGIAVIRTGDGPTEAYTVPAWQVGLGKQGHGQGDTPLSVPLSAAAPQQLPPGAARVWRYRPSASTGKSSSAGTGVAIAGDGVPLSERHGKEAEAAGEGGEQRSAGGIQGAEGISQPVMPPLSKADSYDLHTEDLQFTPRAAVLASSSAPRSSSAKVLEKVQHTHPMGARYAGGKHRHMATGKEGTDSTSTSTGRTIRLNTQEGPASSGNLGGASRLGRATAPGVSVSTTAGSGAHVRDMSPARWMKNRNRMMVILAALAVVQEPHGASDTSRPLLLAPQLWAFDAQQKQQQQGPVHGKGTPVHVDGREQLSDRSLGAETGTNAPAPFVQEPSSPPAGPLPMGARQTTSPPMLSTPLVLLLSAVLASVLALMSGVGKSLLAPVAATGAPIASSQGAAMGSEGRGGQEAGVAHVTPTRGKGGKKAAVATASITSTSHEKGKGKDSSSSVRSLASSEGQGGVSASSVTGRGATAPVIPSAAAHRASPMTGSEPGATETALTSSIHGSSVSDPSPSPTTEVAAAAPAAKTTTGRPEASEVGRKQGAVQKTSTGQAGKAAGKKLAKLPSGSQQPAAGASSGTEKSTKAEAVGADSTVTNGVGGTRVSGGETSAEKKVEDVQPKSSAKGSKLRGASPPEPAAARVLSTTKGLTASQQGGVTLGRAGGQQKCNAGAQDAASDTFVVPPPPAAGTDTVSRRAAATAPASKLFDLAGLKIGIPAGTGQGAQGPELLPTADTFRLHTSTGAPGLANEKLDTAVQRALQESRRRLSAPPVLEAATEPGAVSAGSDSQGRAMRGLGLRTGRASRSGASSHGPGAKGSGGQGQDGSSSDTVGMEGESAWDDAATVSISVLMQARERERTPVRPAAAGAAKGAGKERVKAAAKPVDGGQAAVEAGGSSKAASKKAAHRLSGAHAGAHAVAAPAGKEKAARLDAKPSSKAVGQEKAPAERKPGQSQGKAQGLVQEKQSTPARKLQAPAPVQVPPLATPLGTVAGVSDKGKGAASKVHTAQPTAARGEKTQQVQEETTDQAHGSASVPPEGGSTVVEGLPQPALQSPPAPAATVEQEPPLGSTMVQSGYLYRLDEGQQGRGWYIVGPSEPTAAAPSPPGTGASLPPPATAQQSVQQVARGSPAQAGMMMPPVLQSGPGGVVMMSQPQASPSSSTPAIAYVPMMMPNGAMVLVPTSGMGVGQSNVAGTGSTKSAMYRPSTPTGVATSNGSGSPSTSQASPSSAMVPPAPAPGALPLPLPPAQPAAMSMPMGMTPQGMMMMGAGGHVQQGASQGPHMFVMGPNGPQPVMLAYGPMGSGVMPMPPMHMMMPPGLKSPMQGGYGSPMGGRPQQGMPPPMHMGRMPAVPGPMHAQQQGPGGAGVGFMTRDMQAMMMSAAQKAFATVTGMQGAGGSTEQAQANNMPGTPTSSSSALSGTQQQLQQE